MLYHSISIAHINSIVNHNVKIRYYRKYPTLGPYNDNLNNVDHFIMNYLKTRIGNLLIKPKEKEKRINFAI